MTIANQRGGFLKTLEINRDGSASSETNLKDTFLKKTEGYVMQVTRFVVNNSPPLNLIDEPMFTVLIRGDQNQNRVDNVDVLDPPLIFQPTSYKTYLELARQLEIFCQQIDIQLDPGAGQRVDPNQHRSVAFSLQSNGLFQLKLFRGFASAFYIKVGPQARKYTGLGEYIFVTTDGVNHYTQVDGVRFLFNLINDAQLEIRIAAGLAISFNPQMFGNNVGQDRVFESKRPLSAFDHRLSQDVIGYFPISQSVSFLDGNESHEFLLARFPINDYKEMHEVTKVTEDGLYHLKQRQVTQETVNLGLEDLCRDNPNAVSNFLLPGEIRQCTFKLETRYINDGVITKQPTDMEQGFWSLKLLFSKKMT